MPPKAKAKAKRKGDSELYIKKTSDTEPLMDGVVSKGFMVWAHKAGPTGRDEMDPAANIDPEGNCYGWELFTKAVVQAGSTEEKYILQAVDGDQETFEAPADRCHNVNMDLDTEKALKTDDIGFLEHQNTPSVLDYMRKRYERTGIPTTELWHRNDNPNGIKAHIYVNADPLTICINPFQDVGSGNDEFMVKIRDHPDPENLEPHTFSLTRLALQQAYAVNKPQTIIVSGESGAGKTEAVKMAMRYCAAVKGASTDTRIQDAIMGANPILEAFGNSKTVRNNNSSRFGRYMQLDVGRAGGIRYGTVLNFLLEKSRVVSQVFPERNYHIFYQMFVGASPEQRKKWHLRDWNKYKYIEPQTQTTPGMDDMEEWTEGMKAYAAMGMPEEERDGIYANCSGSLLLGEVNFVAATVDGADGSLIDGPASETALKEACDCFGLDPEALKFALTMRIITVGGAVINSPNNVSMASMYKESFAKAMYDETFYYFVRRLNNTIEPPEGWGDKCYIGILDIFGFEVFKNNSLEQLFINVTNEALQNNFVETVFAKESKLYKEQGVSTADLVFTSNDVVLNCLKGPKNSLFVCLDDTCNGPNKEKENRDELFLAGAYRALKQFDDKFIAPKINAQTNFIVNHTIGEIAYNALGFVGKNMDVMKPEFKALLVDSTAIVPKNLYTAEQAADPNSAKLYIAKQYILQLDGLMNQINSTEPWFIRCIKPNDQKQKLKWVNSKVLVQLFSLSILEALQLKKVGFSYKRDFAVFVKQFQFIDLGVARGPMDDLSKAKAIIATARLDKSLFAIGKSMVFMKTDGQKFMSATQRKRLAAWLPIVTVVAAASKRNTLREKVYNPAKHSSISRFQALARKKLALAEKAEAPSIHECGLGWYRPQIYEQ